MRRVKARRRKEEGEGEEGVDYREQKNAEEGKGVREREY